MVGVGQTALSKIFEGSTAHHQLQSRTRLVVYVEFRVLVESDISSSSDCVQYLTPCYHYNSRVQAPLYQPAGTLVDDVAYPYSLVTFDNDSDKSSGFFPTTA